MAEPVGNLRCTFGCWAIGGIAGLLAAIMFRLIGDMSWAGSIFCGAIFAVVVGLVLGLALCRKLPTLQEAQANHDDNIANARTNAQGAGGSGAVAAGVVGAGAAVAATGQDEATSDADAQADAARAAADARAAQEAKDAEEARAAAQAKAAEEARAAEQAKAAEDARAAEQAKAAEDARAAEQEKAAEDARARAAADARAAEEARAAEVKVSAPLAGEAELADRKGEWKYDGSSDGTGGPSGGDATASGSGSGDVDYDGDGIIEGTNEGTRPAGLEGARGGVADDLKRIKGVGPKMEKLCNSLGFYHFDQIAAWSSDEVAWVDANLEGFKGRVTRDTWVAQAQMLASGGETEFSKKVDDGDVY